MSSSVLLVEKSDAVATVTLNRPDALNAIDMDMRADLTALAVTAQFNSPATYACGAGTRIYWNPTMIAASPTAGALRALFGDQLRRHRRESDDVNL